MLLPDAAKLDTLRQDGLGLGEIGAEEIGAGREDGGALARHAAELAARYEHATAETRLRVAIRDLFPGRIALVSSFGADSAVLLHLVAAIDRATPVVFVDTKMLFAETMDYRDRLVAQLGLTGVTSYTPDAADLAALLPALKTALGDAIREARATDRLTTSAVVLAAGGAGPDLQLQRLLRRSGQALPPTPPILELNPRHTLIVSLAARASAGEPIEAAAQLLLDLARIQDGEAPLEPARFAQRVTDALTASMAQPSAPA